MVSLVELCFNVFMKKSKLHTSNIVFLVIILLLIIPQTRQPIQVLIHKGLSVFSPSIIDLDDREQLTDYNWKLKSNSGELFDFNKAKGKVILINFWATWCPPCIAEMPSLEELYSAYKDKEIVFLFVSNEAQGVVSNFIDKNTYSFPVYSPISSNPKVFNVSAIPRTFLIDKSGNIVVDKTGAANWNSKQIREQINLLLNE